MKAAAFAVLALLLVAALAVTLWLSRSERTSALSAAPQSTNAVETVRTESHALSSVPERSDAVIVPSDVEERVVAMPSTEGDDRLSATIQVIDAATRAPVPHAAVYVFDERDRDAEEYIRSHGVNPEFLRRFGEPYRCDADGRVIVKVRQDNNAIAGVKDSRVGYLELDEPYIEPKLLALVPAPEIRVRVVNLAGAPLPGIPVDAVAAEEGGLSGELVFSATTGSDGNATISICDPLQRKGRWIVRPLACLNRRVECEVNIEELPSHPLLLVMPDTGEVEVQLLRADRTPYEGEADVTLFHGSTNGSTNVVETARCTAGSGRVHWPLVQVGMDLRVRASAPAGGWSRRIAGSGPRRLGEKVTLYVVFDPDSPTFTARVVDSSGRPFAEQTLYLRSMQQIESQTLPIGKNVRTDLEGVFSVRLDGVFREQLHVFLLDPNNSPSELQLGAFATIDLRNPTASPQVFALRLPDVLATGYIVDSNNQPIHGAWVKSATDSDPKSKVIQTRSDDAGYFEVRGWSVARSVQLFAEHFRRSKPVVVAIGAAGVRIVVPSP